MTARAEALPAASAFGLKCPKCQSPDLRTLETRPTDSGVRRRRECETCDYRFTTVEKVQG